MNRTTQTMLLTALILLLVWLLLLSPSRSGYGYHGYHGFYGRSGGWFSYGDSTVYQEPASNRKGSVSGPNNQGRGLHGGK
jgi:hypothetical protein